jgi:hypothetical protein
LAVADGPERGPCGRTRREGERASDEAFTKGARHHLATPLNFFLADGSRHERELQGLTPDRLARLTLGKVFLRGIPGDKIHAEIRFQTVSTALRLLGAKGGSRHADAGCGGFVRGDVAGRLGVG